jgi:hypothetical protein
MVSMAGTFGAARPVNRPEDQEGCQDECAAQDEQEVAQDQPTGFVEAFTLSQRLQIGGQYQACIKSTHVSLCLRAVMPASSPVNPGNPSSSSRLIR